MTATPKHVQLSATGVRTGQTYVIDGYLSDVSGELANWDNGGGASANSETFTSFGERVIINDIVYESGTADVTQDRLVINGAGTRYVFMRSVFDDGNAKRPNLRIPVEANARIALLQL